MSGHADTIREALRGSEGFTARSASEAFQALEALLAENQRLREIVQIVKRRRARFLHDAARNDEERRLDELLALAGDTE